MGNSHHLPKIPSAAGKIMYALLFLFFIPVLEIVWANRLESVIHFPVVCSAAWGWIAGLSGLLLMIWGMLALMIFGKGLPMNAYPPRHFVNRGPYRLFRHPIYWGYVIALAGYFVYEGNSAGLFFVLPVTALCLVALLLGYEEIDLKQRFPASESAPFFSVPAYSRKKPGILTRLTAYVLFIFYLWFSLWICTLLAADPFSTPRGMYFDPYLALPLFFSLLPVLFFREQRWMRRWLLAVLLGISLQVFVVLMIPDNGIKLFYGHLFDQPSRLPVLLLYLPPFVSLVSGYYLGRQYARFRLLLFLLYFILFIFSLYNLGGSLYGALASFLVFLFAAFYRSLWRTLLRWSEKLANSWNEWSWGYLRIINHGFYVGAGAFFGILFSGTLAGRKYAWGILLFALIVTVCAALWAQLIEGSDKLKRPFGYYGALFGIALASLLLQLLGYDVWILIAVISVVMCWVQAIGRLRCLVNGCCHGKPHEEEGLGIHYHHPRSRVCLISGLKNRALHPTQLYSISWLFFCGFIMLYGWYHHFSPSLLFGLYLILTGAGRFVEEAYRGEVQTPLMGRLRLYQWAALLSVLAGILFSMLQLPPVSIEPEWGWEIVFAALAGGFFVFFAMGVDFPLSNARFSRLV